MSTLQSHPRLVAFIDERIIKREPTTSIFVGCCLFGRERWLALCPRESKVGQVRRKRRLEAIDELLNALPGAAVLGYANLPNALFSPGEIDGTADILEMSRTDNIWSQAVAFTVVTGLAWLHHSDLLPGLADLYYDRKDLTVSHRARFESLFWQNLPKIAREAVAKDPSRFRTDASQFRFGIIQGVQKPAPGLQPDPFQRGTNLAHHFCTQAEALIKRGSTGRILVKDRTEDICATITKFTGTPYPKLE